MKIIIALLLAGCGQAPPVCSPANEIACRDEGAHAPRIVEVKEV